MIRCGNQIRLHDEDVERLLQITGVSASKIHTVDELNEFVDRHLPMFESRAPETMLLELLLANEKIRY